MNSLNNRSKTECN